MATRDRAGPAVRLPSRAGIVLSLAVAGAGAGAGAGAAEVGGPIAVELNRLETDGGACRAYLVAQNGTERRFEALTLDLVLFDADGIVARRLAVEIAPLRPGQESVRVFTIDGLSCDGLGRALLNGVLECRDAGGAVEDCRDLIAPSSRATVPFVG